MHDYGKDDQFDILIKGTATKVPQNIPIWSSKPHNTPASDLFIFTVSNAIMKFPSE